MCLIMDAAVLGDQHSIVKQKNKLINVVIWNLRSTKCEHNVYPYCHRNIALNTTQSKKNHLTTLELPYILDVLQKWALLETTGILDKVLPA